MIVFAISDPHLAHAVDKPMDIFSSRWSGHPEKLFRAWRRVVGQHDLVLLPGDISWGTKMNQARPDLEALNALPGFKLVTKGNHDYWWPSKKRDFVLPGLATMRFVHGRTFRVGPLAVAATRGWKLPGDPWFQPQDQPIHDKEVRFLKQALAAVGDAPHRLCMLHYPPFSEQAEPSAFVPLLEAHGIQDLIYGHLHGPRATSQTVTGLHNGIRYHFVSCDAVDFTPVPILELDGTWDFLRASVDFVVLD